MLEIEIYHSYIVVVLKLMAALTQCLLMTISATILRRHSPVMTARWRKT